MASCEYTVRGKKNLTHTELFNYIANTASEYRSSEDVFKILRGAGIAVRKKDRGNNTRMYLVMGQDSLVNFIKAQNINIGARTFFGLESNEKLLEYTSLGQRSNNFTGINTLYGLQINEQVLAKMQSIDRTKVARNAATAEEVAALLAKPGSPYYKEYITSEIARRENNSERSKFSRMAQIKVDEATTQITKLKNAFAEAGIDVEVTIDGDIQEKGILLPVTAENPTPRIVLNPNRMSEDTVYHEFAHIFVDLLGYNHPLVQQAVKELRNTLLYEEVLAKYPELAEDQERLDKEVIVTAIGLEGARMEKKNPTKLQKIFNKLFRALGKLLGIQPNGVSELAKNMIVNKIDTKEFNGALAPYAQKSVSDLRVKNVIDEIKLKLDASIRELQVRPEETGESIRAIKLQQERLKKVESVEDLVDFISYASRIASRAAQTLENIKREYNETEINEPQRLQMLQDIYEVHQWMGAFHDNTGSNQSILTDLGILLRQKEKSFTNKISEADRKPVKELLTKVRDTIDTLDDVDREFTEVVIPILADLLLQYHKPELNDKIDAAIARVRATGRIFGLDKVAKRSPEYKELRRKKKEKEITAEEYKDALIEFNVQILQSRKIGRETLINELKEQQKNKSGMSFLFDPLIFSSQAAIQLFGLQVKNALYSASDKFRETQYELRDIYKEFAVTRGAGMSDAVFNDPVQEVHTYRVLDYEHFNKTNTAESKGEYKYKTVNLLTLVQPFIGYHEAEAEALERIAKKHKRPDDAEELKTWYKSKYVKAYRNEINKWYADNSDPIDNANELYINMLDERTRIEKFAMPEALKLGDATKVAFLEAELLALTQQMGAVYDSRNKQYKGTFVQPNKSYINPKYVELTKDKSSVEYRYYITLLNLFKSKQAELGKTNQVKNSWDNFSYVLPSDRKKKKDKVIEGAHSANLGQVVSAGKDMIVDSFQVLETDTEYGVLIGLNGYKTQGVPVYFTNPEPEENVSRDTLGSILKFTHMTNMFVEKSNILGSVEMMRTVLDRRGTVEEDESGNAAVNKASVLLKGVTKRFAKQDKSKDPDNHFRHVSEFIDSVFYGETMLKGSGKFSGAKLAGTVTLATSAIALVLNPLQAVNQFIIDNERMVEEGIGREYFGPKDFLWAKWEYYKNLALLKTVPEIGAYSKDNKMLQAAELLDALSDMIDQNGDKVTGARLKKGLSLDTAFIYQNMAEHETAVTRMLAVARGYKGKLQDKNGKVLLNEKGKPADLYEMLIKDAKGMLILDPRVANVSLARIRSVLAGLQRKSNQIKGPVDRTMAERRAGGKLVTLFRKFMAPGFRRHWGHGGLGNVSYLHVDEETGMLSQSAYWVTYRYALDELKNLTSILDGGKFASVWSELLPTEKSNVLRSSVQAITFILGGIISTALLGAASDTDDEKEKARYMFWAYQARRLQTELGAFLDPREIIRITMSPTAAARPVKNLINLATHVAFSEVPYMLGRDGLEKDIYYQRKSGTSNKGDRKIWKKMEKLIPVWSGLNKDAEQAIKWFDLNT
jgi:hypothetical protein